MSWGTELWDQYSRLEKHTQSGIEAVDKYTHFVKERQRIESEYAANLKKLIKGYSPRKKDEETDFSTKTCFGQLLQEMTGIANQHEIIADSLAQNVVKELQTYIKELKEERRKHFQDAKQEEQALNSSIRKLEHAKEAYRSAFNDFMKSKGQFHKVDADVNQTKAQVEKCRRNMDQKDKSREDCKNEYILQLQQTNKDQRDYYSTKLPAVFQRIQEMDEKRINKLGEYFKKFAESNKSVLPLIGKCLDSISAAGDSVNATQDSNKVTERHKTGLPIPDDFEMMDLDEQNSNQPQTQQDNTSISSEGSVKANGGGTISGRSKTKKGGVLGIFNKKDDDGGSRKIKIPHTSSFRKKQAAIQYWLLKMRKEEVKPKDDFSHLPPSQQRRELQKKIDEIQAQVDQEMKSKDALTKMRDVYTKNPALGDPTSTDKELATIGKKLDTLRLELQKYQGYMDQTDGKPAGSTPQHTPHGTPVASRAHAEDSNPPTPIKDAPMKATPIKDGTNGTSTGSEPEQPTSSPRKFNAEQNQSFDDDVDGEFDDPDDPDDVQPLWQAKAVYHFETEDPNLLCLGEGEVIDVLEEDDGDGWTRVRRNNEEGYVPTSYLVKTT